MTLSSLPLVSVAQHIDRGAVFIENAEHLDALAELVLAADYLNEALVRTVREARRNGETWQSVGDALGVTKQAAIQRFSHRVSVRET